jgi:hypothetical protein
MDTIQLGNHLSFFRGKHNIKRGKPRLQR